MLVGACTIVAIAVVTILLGLGKVGQTWGAALQVGSVILGAWLGAILQSDSARIETRAQTRPAIRRLFDHADRLSGLVVAVERRLEQIANSPQPDQQEADWYWAVAEQLRREIDSIGSAIEDWRDLAPDVYDIERANYLERTKPSTRGRKE